MFANKSKTLLFNLIVAVLLCAAPAIATVDSDPKPEPKQESVEAVQGDIDHDMEGQAEERQEEVLAEAEIALDETRAALKALDEENTQEALAALERATGKLELLVARKPELALAPAGVSMRTFDLYAQPETIEEVIDRAEQFFDDGRIQDARAIVENLASEAVITVTHLPLATYPDAIKAIAPLIDEGKTDEAKRLLQTALNTVVVVDYVHPLPLLRAEKLLESAEALAENAERTEEENEKLAGYLSDARNQVEMAELLGYGEHTTFDRFYDQIEEIENKTKGGASGTGFFDAIRETVEEWRSSVSDS